MPRIQKQEFEKRLRVTERMLVEGHFPHAIKKTLAAEFGVSRRSVEKWISVARARLQQASGVPREEHKARVGAQLRRIETQLNAIANDVRATPLSRINALRACERACHTEAKLYGLYEAEEVRILGRDPLSEALDSDEELVAELEAERENAISDSESEPEESAARPDRVRDQDSGGTSGSEPSSNGTSNGTGA